MNVRTTMALLLLAVAGGCSMFSSRPAAEDLPDLRVVTATDTRRFEAMIAADTATLGGMLAKDLQYVHSSGQAQTRDEFLEAVRSGRTRYRSIVPYDVAVRPFGQAAVVTGRAHMQVTGGGVDREFDVRYTAVYRHVQERWLLAVWQSTQEQP
jgi:hypothetical protein